MHAPLLVSLAGLLFRSRTGLLAEDQERLLLLDPTVRDAVKAFRGGYVELIECTAPGVIAQSRRSKITDEPGPRLGN